MLSEHGPPGRMEKRLLIMVAVRLEPARGVGNDGQEKAYIDNISPHGARVISRHPWQVGDVVKLTSLYEGPVCGQVVYCQDLLDDRYAIGVHILDRRIPWSIVERFWGT